MLGLPELRVSATCVRVPVLYAHSQAVHIETADELTADDARNLLMAAPGVVLVDEPAAAPLPAAARGGRPRRGAGRAHPRGRLPPARARLWVVSDNLRKGAATNAVQIAESLVMRGWL